MSSQTPKPAKRNRQLYTEEDLASAVQAISDGMNYREAFKEFGIPTSTLCDYNRKRSTVGVKAGRKVSVPRKIEKKIVKAILQSAKAGFPVTRSMVLTKVGRIVARHGLNTQFKNGQPGEMYWKELKKRFPLLTVRSPECCSRKILKPTKEQVMNYFDDVFKMIEVDQNRKLYTEEDLASAMQAIADGMSYREASKEFGIPTSTLGDYNKKRSVLGVKAGRKESVPREMEEKIVEAILQSAKDGSPMTKSIILTKVGQIVARLGVDTQFKYGQPGDRYWRGLKKRFPQLTVGSPECCSRKRLKGLTEEKVMNYFYDVFKMTEGYQSEGL